MMLKLAKLGIAITAVALLIVPAAFAGVPDVSQSYFVPQAVSGSTLEGTAAIANFIGCPNNENTTQLTNGARLKVVVRASDGSPIANIPAADICLLFNGGIPLQGFSGAGDDSVVANFQYNPAANCPDVRCIQADAPTDADGTTFITLHGVGNVRDSGRKWGGWAGDVPVMVLGFKLPGYLTTADGEAHGLSNYTAHVKTADLQGSRTTVLNQGELVNSADVLGMRGFVNLGAYEYWLDFQAPAGALNSSDYFYVRGHNTHSCNIPNAP